MGRLRVLSGSEVCRILEQHGFEAVRQQTKLQFGARLLLHPLGLLIAPILVQRRGGSTAVLSGLEGDLRVHPILSGPVTRAWTSPS